MSDPFLGEIRMFAGNFAPRQWALCTGGLINISQFNALYALLGTTYGGDGRTTFALPDMRGRIPVHQGIGPGLSPRRIGWQYGEEEVVLSISNLPNHSHDLQASTTTASSSNPSNDVLGAHTDGDFPYTDNTSDPTLIQTMSSQAVASMGDSRPHYNMMPSLAVTFIICMIGEFPQRQ